MRSHARLSLALLGLFASACSESAAPPAAPAAVASAPSAEPAAALATDTLPAARALVERFLAVTKYDVVRRSQSRHERATLTLPVGTGTVENFSRRPAESRQVMNLGDMGLYETGVTQGRAWMVLPGNSASLIEGVELLQKRVEADYDAFAKPAEQIESMTTLARVTFEDVECFKVEVVLRVTDGLDPEATRRARTSHEYYEVESGYLRGQECFAEGELSKGPFTMVFGDYREFSGTLLPARMVVRQDALELVTTRESLEFDMVQAEDLAPPRAIQRLLEAEAEDGD